jgi:hypothetical protein
MSWSVCTLLWGQGTTLRAFCSSAPWQIYETLYFLLRVQECRFITPSQGAGLIVLSMGNGILTHLSFKFPDPKEVEAKIRRAGSCWIHSDLGDGVVQNPSFNI